MPVPPESDLAWVAGLYEAEGSCSIWWRKETGRPHLKVQLGMCDKEPVMALAKIMPFGSVSGPYLSRQAAERGWRPTYKWVGTGWPQIAWFLDALKPWLSRRRTDQLERLLGERPDQGKLFGGPSGKRLSPDQVEWILRSTETNAVVAREIGFSANTVRSIRKKGLMPVPFDLPELDGDRSTEIWLPWAAGLYEGEGSCTITRSKGWTGGRFTMSMCDLEPIEKFLSVVGFGTVNGPSRPQKDGWSPRYTWRSAGREKIEVGRALFLPWLSPRRLGQIDSVLGHIRQRKVDACGG